MTASRADVRRLLVDAAFGDRPQRWPLPAAEAPDQRWLRAVAAGGQGRYAAALTDLDAVDRAGDAVLRSLSLSTRASFLRQLGWHRAAAGWDGRALAVPGADDRARADALIGLAADALGVGRFALSGRLLDRAGAAAAAGADLRLPVRLGWVGAELAMAQGDGAGAVDRARRAVTAAAAFGSARHRVKSDVVLAAALCTAGELDRCREVADAALDAAAGFGLLPLHWALASLLAGVGSAAHSPAQVAAFRDAGAQAVQHRGGVWSRR
jgi:hypothetical protein